VFLGEVLLGNLSVRGRVRGVLTAQSIAEAGVRLQSHHRDWHTKTDDGGGFTFRGVSPGPAEIIVEADSYGRERRTITVSEDAEEVNVELKPQRVIHLKTVDDLGRPVAGVTVECTDDPRDDFRSGITDEAGAVTFRGLHFDASTLLIRLSHEEFVSFKGFSHTISTLPEASESTHTLVMARAARIQGRVLDAQTDKPLYGARLMTGQERSDDSPRDWSDVQGYYSIHGIAPGLSTVTVNLSDYAAELQTVEVKAGETATLDFRLHPAAQVKGVIKNDQGEPIAGAEIMATRWRGSETLGIHAVTDREGRFVLENAPRDEFDIAVFARGAATAHRTVKADAGTPLEITLVQATTGEEAEFAPRVRVGDGAPALTLTALNGVSIFFGDLAGKTVLLDFWATWCGPCLEDVPALTAVWEKFGARKDFAMIGVSLDDEESAVRDFVKNNPRITWPQVCGDTSGAQTAIDQYGIKMIPAVYVIGPDGRIVAAYVRVEEAAKQIEQLLKKPSPE